MTSRFNPAKRAEDMNLQNGNKRLAEDSPEKPANKKRGALIDLTNAIVEGLAGKKGVPQITKKADKKSSRKFRSTKDDKLTVSKSLNSEPGTDESLKSSQEALTPDDDSTVYLTPQESLKDNVTPEVCSEAQSPASRVLPPGVEDFDAESADDPFAEPKYAMDIFNYYKEREVKFKLEQYMSRQPELTKGMRAVLADWLVEVQESFELNHETLYLAVKLVDHYLMRKTLAKSSLQLLGATSIFLACKFDERCPPSVDDFLYICDDAYNRQQMIRMEIDIIKTLKFDLGIPLSYRFLRRFARCSKVSMEILTLARYVLESSLLDYEMVAEKDSLLAAACLHLALRMKGQNTQWTANMEYYTGYKVADLVDLERRLNRMIALPAYKNLVTVKTKYTHKVFLEVAKIPCLPLDVPLPV